MNLDTTVATLPRCDVELHGLAWIEDGRDVVFHVRLPGIGPIADRDRWIVCRWTEGLMVSLVYAGGRGGHPLTWDSTIEREADGTWSLQFDFAGAGEVRLRCAEVSISPSSPEPVR